MNKKAEKLGRVMKRKVVKIWKSKTQNKTHYSFWVL